MKKYIMTSKKFSGYIEINYSDGGILIGIDIDNAEISEEQHIAILRNLPIEDRHIDKLVANTSATVVAAQEQVTFEDFRKEYFRNRHKDNSSKKKAETRWNRMSEAQRVLAVKYIKKYMANVPYGTVPKLAETYLNSEVWTD